MPTATTASTLPHASPGDTLAVLGDVLLPNVAKGPIIRRPKAVALAERLALDRRAVRRLQQLRDRYGAGPLMLRLPLREQAVILDAEHVHRVLAESPEPFATASSEKRAALAHFEPKGALISHGPPRGERRRFNERVLDGDDPLHRLAQRFAHVVDEEAQQLLANGRAAGGVLDWDTFADAWFRIVRRVVFGDTARDDEELRNLINRLRADANWGPLMPRRKRLRRRFFERLNGHLERAEPGSLAGIIATTPRTRQAAPDHQVPQWLFAFDPAGMTTFRALALLASHAALAERARAEIREAHAPAGQPLPFLRACILESLRLWPTTPMVLRQTTRETRWDAGVMPAGTGILIFAPFFHRDDSRLPFADRFEPDIWLDQGADDLGRPRTDWPLIPFSGGPAICPGRNLVLLLTSNMLAALLDDRPLRLRQPTVLDPGAPLPATLDNYGLEFEVDA